MTHSIQLLSQLRPLPSEWHHVLQEIPAISFHMIWWNAMFGWGLGCVLTWTHFIKGKYKTKIKISNEII